MERAAPSRPQTGVAPAELAAARGDSRLGPAFSALAGDESITVLSLDVFDTLLWRKVPEPVDAFGLLGQRLQAAGILAADASPELFAKLREAAEWRAREKVRDSGRGVEVTLREIHAEIPRWLFTHAPSADELEEAECGLERDLLVCDLDVVDLVGAARESGRQVVAVSDTYFSPAQLKRFLDNAPLDATSIDRVFTSSAHGAGKASGLFSVVLDDLGRAAGEVLHVGDNHFSDVVAPARLGIRTVFFERRPAALERVIERERVQHAAALDGDHGDGGLASLRGKVLHRAEGIGQPEGLRAFWQFGAASLGPVLTGFAEWVQAQALEAGASRAFCLMREGHLLAGLVDAARPAGERGASAQPLWLSRQVCARAAITEGTRPELEALFSRRQLPTLREFLTTIALALDDVPNLAQRADTRLDDAGFGDIVIEEILASSQLRARVVAHSQALRRRILRYIEQVRPPGEERLVLVDLGWRATTQATVEGLLREAGADCRTLGLYLVTADPATPRLLEGIEARGFLAECGLPEAPVTSIMRGPEILEQVSMPDHGSQVGLTEDLQPVLMDADEPSMQSVERAAVQQGVSAFQREWLRYRAAASDRLPELSRLARTHLLAMTARTVAAPTADEAALFGGWMHDENFGSGRADPIARGPLAAAAPYLDPFGLVDVPMTELYWPFGLAALHDEHLAASLRAASGGVVAWEAFSSELETGPFDVTPDLGWGFEAATTMSLPARRNRRGLSFVRATVRGDFVKRLRLRPAREPCLLRLDWISLRCLLHERPDPVEVRIESERDVAALRIRGARLLAPKVLIVTGTDPRIDIDLERLAGGQVWRAELQCAFAVLPLIRSQAPERWRRTKAAVRALAKESALGAPLRVAKRLAGRLAGR